ncbi:hypothetical protein N7492_001648 [Penicillium capsulatum]|uniref:Calcium-transporting ATPase n=1 Tax=Penicillium capsulatum TaxID=69766 RepID=A0A9W9IU76_9EURO|nr:hypothetical protein N7492_001648 [Penicillium capsulatum]KAJ6129299.1 hypothetical protein N7512_002079 [Penicillium capsulatum]
MLMSSTDEISIWTRRVPSTHRAKALFRFQRMTEKVATKENGSPFSISPDVLSDIVQSKDPRELHSVGGLRGLEKALRTDLQSGLSVDETYLDHTSHDSHPRHVHSATDDHAFTDRKKFLGDNFLPTRKPPGFLWLMWMAYNDPVLFLLTGAAVVSLALGLYQTFGTPHSPGNPPVEWVEGVSILVAVVVIILASAINDFQKELKFRKLNKKKEDRNVWVIRSARTQEIRISNVLVGDIVHIQPGDIAPADGVLIRGHQVKCDESSLTGESEPVDKHPFKTLPEPKAEQDISTGRMETDPFIFSHTKIVEGVGDFLVLATGSKSSHGRILSSLDEDDGFTPLQQRLSVLAKRISQLGGAAALVLFVILFIRFLVNLRHSTHTSTEKGQSFLNVFILALTIVVIAVPEGLPLAVTLALSFATNRMIKDHNLVRQLRACETMGNATDICSDKTGTLTQNRMTVMTGFFNPSMHGAHSQMGSSKEFDHQSVGERMRSLPHELKSLLKDSIMVNSTAIEGQEGDDHRQFYGSQTEAALLRFSQDHLGLGRLDDERANIRVLGLLPFDSTRKYMVTIIQLDGNRCRVFVKGAAELLLGRCTGGAAPTPDVQAHPISRELADEARGFIEKSAMRSLRTIALCYCDLDNWTLGEDGDIDQFNDVLQSLTLLGLFGIQDPLRADAWDAVQACRGAGINVRMVTGDNLLTAKAIAAECGIVNDPEDLILDAQDFRSMDEIRQRETVPNLKVLARSRPDDKRVLVQRLKELGRVVAVTGDGTNDAPALAAADVGFSMGIQGTEIAREASSIVLMNDTFSSIVKAIMWGRAVGDAIKKFLQFQITITFTSVGLAFVSAVANSEQESVLTPVQLMWVNLFQDTLAALALATDPPTRRVLNRYPEPKSSSLINAQMWKMIIGQSIYQMVVTLVLYFAGAAIFSYHTEHEMQQLQTAVFNTYVWMQIFNMYNNRQIERSFNLLEGVTRNWLFIAITSIMMGVQILVSFVGGRAFSVVRMTGDQWAYSLVLGFISIPVGFVLQAVPDCVVEKPMAMLERLWHRISKRNSSATSSP